MRRSVLGPVARPMPRPQGRIDVVDELLCEGAEIDASTTQPQPRTLGQGFPPGTSPLILASAVRDQPEMLELLLMRRADATAMAPGLGTALHAACLHGRRMNADVLLAHNAAAEDSRLRLTERVDTLGVQPLRVCGSAEMVRHLLTEHPSLMQAELARGTHPGGEGAVSMLCLALARGGPAGLVRELITAGCDPTAPQSPSPHYCHPDGMAPSLQAADWRANNWLARLGLTHVSRLTSFLAYATRCTPLHHAAFDG